MFLEARYFSTEQFTDIKLQILNVAKSKVKSLAIRNAKDKVTNDDVLESWNQDKPDITYPICFDSDELVKLAVKGINSIQTHKGSYRYQKGTVEMSQVGVKVDKSSENSVQATMDDAYKLPDIITFLQNKTNLTRKTIVLILRSVDNLDDFKHNPLSYMNQAVKIIDAVVKRLIIESPCVEK